MTASQSRGGRGVREERTKLLASAAPRPPARGWKKYQYASLEKVNRHQARLLRNLEWMVPNVRIPGELSEALTKSLGALFEAKVSLTVEAMQVVHASKLRRFVGEPAFLAMLAPQPQKTRGLLEVELSLASKAIDLLLGGAGDAIALRPLTDLEEAVITYVLLEVLQGLAPALDPSLPKLRIERVVKTFDEAASILAEDEHLAVVQLRVALGAAAGYVRIFVPESVLVTVAPASDAPVRRARRSAEAARHASRLHNVKVQLRAEIGQVSILSGDLAQIRERDVVLVDTFTARPDRGEGGTAKLRLGAGALGWIEAELAVVNGRYGAKVMAFVRSEAQPAGGGEAESAPALEPAPPRSGFEDERGEMTSPGNENWRDAVDANADGAELLNDIPLQISVEMGRVPISAEEIVGLKVGHVFDLNRSAGEPLDLSVNGKVIAQGELVEIEGTLGIRILSLAG
jgi:type III secretion protein Q